MKLKEVLVIDDNDADLFYTRIVLESAGVAERVVSFETATDALDYLREPEGRLAELVLLDINMPEMDGFAFLEAYQLLQPKPPASQAVIMLTSSPDPTDRARALSYACVKGYVVKPLELPNAGGLLQVFEATAPLT